MFLQPPIDKPASLLAHHQYSIAGLFSYDFRFVQLLINLKFGYTFLADESLSSIRLKFLKRINVFN
ncbi:hypothetical protein BKI52_01255 [marine bacterium AO1-C]|nr:hypothetical protein BKI52_01255 [marine bacterium AO1-C]